MALLNFPTPTTLRNILDPTLAQDAATKNYVDTVVSTGGISGSTYGNANVTAYLPTHTGNITANAITTTGPVAPAQLILPPFELSTLPTISVMGSMIFVTDAPGGSTPAFYDGTHWRSVIDRAIILGLFDNGQDWGFVLDYPASKFANLGLITAPVITFYDFGSL
jgi:hypothetical protein